MGDTVHWSLAVFFLMGVPVTLASMIVSWMLAGRLQRYTERRVWPGYRFRMVKWGLFGLWFGPTWWDLSELIERAGADPRYKTDRQLARLLQALWVAWCVLVVAAVSLGNT